MQISHIQTDLQEKEEDIRDVQPWGMYRENDMHAYIEADGKHTETDNKTDS